MYIDARVFGYDLGREDLVNEFQDLFERVLDRHI